MTFEKSFRLNNTIDTNSALYSSGQQYPFNHIFHLDAQNYNKFEVMSLVSVRYNDIYYNSGYLTLDATGLLDGEFHLSAAPTSLADLCTKLNNSIDSGPNTLGLLS